jgi:hypothetical protein
MRPRYEKCVDCTAYYPCWDDLLRQKKFPCVRGETR